MFSPRWNQRRPASILASGLPSRRRKAARLEPAVIPSVREGPGRLGGSEQCRPLRTARPPGSLAYARDDGLFPLAATARQIETAARGPPFLVDVDAYGSVLHDLEGDEGQEGCDQEQRQR